MNLFIDIETIGTEDPAVVAEIAATIAPPANISKAETLAAWEAEKKPVAVNEAVAKTAFDGGLGRVIVFGYAIDDGPAQSIFAAEPELLARIPAMRGSCNVVGHNVTWDIRFLWQRFLVNQVPMPSWVRNAVRAKPWDNCDTMTLWNPERDKKVSLERLCRLLSIPSSKNGLDGSKVWDAFREGRILEIAAYCRADVEATRACYRRMLA